MNPKAAVRQPGLFAASGRVRKSGFALVVTISLMVLLALLAVGLLSLSSISLRNSANAVAMSEARANARLALVIAIAELQRHTGADTRVTASAQLLDEENPPVLGVWRSWEGTDHEDNGRPIPPDYGAKNQPESSGGRFLSWLVSSVDSEGNPSISDAPGLVEAAAGAKTVPLLADGSLMPGDSRQVHVLPTGIVDGGSIAWWISGENQKARLGQPYEPRANGAAGLAERAQSHTVADPAVFGLVTLVNDPEPHDPGGAAAKPARKAVTRQSMALIEDDNPVEPDRRFHDFSTNAVGLLTNTATGGWRKDLSILSERWDDINARYPGRRLPLFRFSPEDGDTSSVQKPTVSNHTPAQSLFYPWSSYSLTSPQKWPNTWHAASSSWQSLVNFATLYRDFTYSNGAVESPFIWAPVMKWRWRGSEKDATDQEFYDYNHTPRIHPILARFQFIVYVRATNDPNRPGRYRTDLIYSPVVTLWNPYNVRLTIDNPGAPSSGVVIGGKRSFPAAFTAQPLNRYSNPFNIPLREYRMLSNGNFQYMDTNGNFGGEYDNHLPENRDLYNPDGSRANTLVDLRTWGINLPNGELTFEPGEVRMFTPDGDAERRFGGTAIGTKDGYQPAAPSGLPVTIRNGNLGPNDFFWYVLKNEVYTQPFRFRSPGRGFNVSFGMSTGNSYTQGTLYSGVSEEMMSMTALTNAKRAKVYWPDQDFEPHGYTVAEIASVPAMPLYSITIGPRFTIGTGTGTPQSRPTKGFVQSDPLAGMSLVDPGADSPNSHPANGNFEISYDTLAFGSTLTPNLSDREGFIVTGYQSGDGLSRIITHELPLRPIASLVELQAWNPRGKNPMPPYQTHLIGNSDATPMIPGDAIVPPVMTPDNPAENLQHDDAYCANHLLFDDFFFSSIAPRPVDFGNNIARDIETVYRDFLNGEQPLTNRAYKPISIDTNLSDGDVTRLVGDIVNSPRGDGWMKVASRLEVDGMFNVNSTSVDAWRGLLGHARSMDEIAYHSENGIAPLDGDDDRPHPVTRAALAPDIEAGSDGAGENSEVTGFRRLTDAQITDLAEKIVEQVRLRGPFLSLSEFVNRQLGSDGDLALAGAVQSAINSLEDDPMSVLRDPGSFLSDDTMASKAAAGSQVDGARLAGVDYEFEEAAEGSSLYGLPGWIRQADVLRPIAPVLSARDDTFTVRAYGDARDADGNVTARAWCEATVRRQRDFVDSADPADATDGPSSELNRIFGRRYQVVSFRWLSGDEV
ncbi:hypothetical protein [Haloferula sp. A504]|uniref:hypothetical protein n=1 Tax=Haloferula sp. A504 TaxID=3373601 RepID=UPI0031BFDC61|nr:hypothetical protein [Verrucomicrobiaceae bacterium E54]